jgi:hypothetical protein
MSRAEPKLLVRTTLSSIVDAPTVMAAATRAGEVEPASVAELPAMRGGG